MKLRRFWLSYLVIGIIAISIPAIALAQEVTIKIAGDKVEVSIPSIGEGMIAIIPISESADFTVRTVEIGAARQVDQVEITIEISDEKPSGFGDVNGTVYRYLLVTLKNLGSDDFLHSKLSFGIPKTWLDANGVEKTSVGLLGIFEGEWSIQPTQELQEIAEEVIFTAEMPNLSFLNYAIAGNLPAITTTTTQTTTKTTTITTSIATVTTTSTPIVTSTITTVVQGENSMTYIALGVAGVAVVILLVVFRSSRSKT